MIDFWDSCLLQDIGMKVSIGFGLAVIEMNLLPEKYLQQLAGKASASFGFFKLLCEIYFILLFYFALRH